MASNLLKGSERAFVNSPDTSPPAELPPDSPLHDITGDKPLENAMKWLSAISPLSLKLEIYATAAVLLGQSGRIDEAMNLFKSQGELLEPVFLWNRILNDSLHRSEEQAVLDVFARFAELEGDWERSIDELDWLKTEINETALLHENMIERVIVFLVSKGHYEKLIERMTPLITPEHWLEDIIEELEKKGDTEAARKLDNAQQLP